MNVTPKLPPGWTWETGHKYKLVVTPPSPQGMHRTRIFQLTPFPSTAYPHANFACNSHGFTISNASGSLEPPPETITTMQEAVDYAYVLWRLES